MSTWPVQDAKARFSEVLDASVHEGPQIVTKRGAETAVIVSIDEWRALQASVRPSVKELLLQESGPRDLFIPERLRRPRRPLPTL